MSDNDKKKRKRNTALLSASVIAAGVVTFAAVQQSGNGFQPFGTKRDLQNNQVVFSNDKTSKLDETKSDNSSEMLEKKDQNNDEKAQSAQNTAQYLFAGKLPEKKKTRKVVGTSDGTEATNDSDGNNKTIYDNNGNGTGNGDSVLPGDDGTGGTSDNSGGGKPASNDGNPGGDGNGGDSGNNGDNGSGDNGNGDNGSGDHGGNGNGDDDGGNGGKDDNGNGGKDDDTSPASDSAKDPDSEKVSVRKDPIFTDRQFTDDVTLDNGVTGSEDSSQVIIQKPYFADGNTLYRGQTVDAKTIFDCLETYVLSNDGKNVNRYIWGDSALGKYVRIDAISFDGGDSWKSNFPVQIPMEIKKDQMKIRVSYRLSSKSSKWITREIVYDPDDSRILLLYKKIQSENSVISKSNIFHNEYQENGSTLNLLRSQQDFLGKGTLKTLFPGWTEHGKRVSWFYKVTPGRHILEPADKVPLDTSRYVVKMKNVWMTEDLQVDESKGEILCYLQTLTNYKGKERTLKVPKYVQSVDIDANAEVNVDTLYLPDTVMYVNAFSKGMRVNKSYQTDADNPYYTVTSEGVLTNKAVTEICAVPYQRKELTVPATIKKVQIPAQNQIRVIRLEGSTLAKLPQISFSTLKNTKIVVKDALLEAFMEKNKTYFDVSTGVTVASAENPEISYCIDQSVIVSSKGVLRKVLNSGSQILKLSNRVTSIETKAFAKSANGVRTIIMPQNGNVVTLDKNCLEGSSVNQIQCCSQKQLRAVKQALADCGKEDVEVVLQQVSQEGYVYCITEDDQEEVISLISVPEDLREFDGVVTAPEESRTGTAVHITEIAEKAFENCKQLRWVTIPESVNRIEKKAFSGCTDLQGVLIDTKDSIVLGDQAFEGCNALRFVASNAKECERSNDYDPLITDSMSSGSKFFYTLHDTIGYGGNSIYFTKESNVESYQMLDVGDGEKVLYGNGSDGIPWIALRSGLEVPDSVKLPDTTVEIFDFAFAHTTSPSGAYTVNWEELRKLGYLDTGAFGRSEVGGKVSIYPDRFIMGSYAFTGCTKLTEADFQGANGSFSDPVFSYCSSLRSVRINSLSDGICAGTFSGCDSLTDITITGDKVTSLRHLDYNGSEYRFNLEWTMEEETQKLRVHVPETLKKAYLKLWRYYFAGYKPDDDTKTFNYYQVWDDTFWNYFMDSWDYPEDETIDDLVEENYLKAENRIRALFGMDSVSEPTQFYPYRVSNGIYILQSVSPETTDITLDPDTLDLPDGEILDQIGRNAFSKCKNLKRVVIQEGLFGIYPNAFAGVESDSLTLEFESSTPTSLLFASGGKSYQFGVDESKIHIKVPAGSEEDYIRAWSYALAGYADDSELTEAVTSALKKENNGAAPTQTQIEERKMQILTKAVNRVRSMLGLEPVDETSGQLEKKTGQTAEKKEEKKSETDTDKNTKSNEKSEAKKETESDKKPEIKSDEKTEIKSEEETKSKEEAVENKKEDPEKNSEKNSDENQDKDTERDSDNASDKTKEESDQRPEPDRPDSQDGKTDGDKTDKTKSDEDKTDTDKTDSDAAQDERLTAAVREEEILP